MKRIILVTMILFIFTSFMCLNAQWAKTYGGRNQLDEVARSVQQTNDGGYIVAGWTDSFVDWEDFWVVKINSYGEIEWQKSYGGIDKDRAYSIQQTTDEGYIVAGYNGLDGSYNLCVLKLSSVGNIEWQKTYKQTEQGYDIPSCIQQTADGGYIIIGFSPSVANNTWILKLDSLGEIEWQKSHGYDDGQFYFIQQTSDGGYIVTGSFWLSFWQEDFWVLKLDSLGNIEWQKAYGNVNTEDARSVQQTSDDGYIIGGLAESGGGGVNIGILKLDSLGEIEWQKTYGGSDADLLRAIKQTSNDGYIVGGITWSFGAGSTDVWVLKLDTNGEIDWQRTYGGISSEDVYSVQQTTDEGYIVAGKTDSFGSGGEDIFLLKLFPDGNIHSSCGFIGSSDATITNTFVIPRDVSEVFQDGDFTILVPTDSIQDTNAIVNLICESPRYSLTISATSGGSTDPAPDTYSHYGGTEITITATPDENYRFNEWTGDVLDGHENDNPITITVDLDKSITANFIRQYTLTTRTRIGGTILPEPGIHTYDEGTRVIVEAIPESGWRWSGWAGDYAGDAPPPHENPTTIVMNADKLIDACFIKEYTLTIAAGTGGTTNPTPGTHTYRSGIEVVITAIPDIGYGFSEWIGDVPSGLEIDNPITITMDSNKSITANFVRKYTLTISTGTGGSTNPTPGTYTHDPGTQVSVQAVPNSGYQFSGWSGDASGTTNPITIAMNSDKSVTANFTPIQYTLTIETGTGGTTDPSLGTYTHDSGTQVSVTAIPNSGYSFTGWSGDASGTTNPITIIMDSDKSVTANFEAVPPPPKPPDEDGKKDGCFIATATYGSPLHSCVKILRDFRDKYLMPTKLGRMLVGFYYKNSPFFADLIAKHKALKIMAKFSLLPIIVFSYSMLHFGVIISAVMLVFIFVFPILLILFFRNKKK